MKPQISLIAVVSLAVCALSSRVTADDPQGTKWGYKDGAKSTSVLPPAKWGQGYSDCGGKNQSPIDLRAISPAKQVEISDSKKKAPLAFSGDCSSFGLKALEDTFKWEATNATCKVHKGDKAYELLQFHMHMPSEHTVDGESFAAEAHFVHQEIGGTNLLVIGMFMSEAESKQHRNCYTKDQAKQAKQQQRQLVQLHPWLEAVWNSVPSVNSTVQVSHSYAALLTEKMGEGSVFNYPGSLTTPPCSEGVDWWVMQSPVYASKAALETFKQQLATLEATDGGKGARPVQPLNDRQVIVY
ncbi:hypothetical protein PybrP1_011830 [[Pythium] brassicae (nom. inval.)]|nr:hypothetical protein PybrP1_011830 [[Pythium] brassicae (nom. inval.)]